MPIEKTEGGVVITGEAIQFARLLVLRGGLRLQKKGIKVNRGRSVSSIVKAEFGFKGNIDKLILQLDALIESEKEKGTPQR